MGKSDVYRALTLWFTALIFVQTGSGSVDHPLFTVASVVALLVAYLLPVVLVADIVFGVAVDDVAGS